MDEKHTLNEISRCLFNLGEEVDSATVTNAADTLETQAKEIEHLQLELQHKTRCECSYEDSCARTLTIKHLSEGLQEIIDYSTELRSIPSDFGNIAREYLGDDK